MSNETRWTKGPWAFREKTGEVGTIDQSDTQSYGMMLVICNIDTYDHPEHKANARLIAAAPDLYEELEKARRTIQALIDDGYMGYLDFISNIDAALAKARGEQS